MRWIRPGLALTMAFQLIAIGCGSDDGGAAVSDPLRLLPLHAEPDPEHGRIVDSGGREVLLRGVNVNALVEYWQGTEFPTTFPLTEDDADLMAAIGWNTVRLLLSWSRVEPQEGVYDDEYLARVRDAVEMFSRRGIYSIIDLHQDAWGATLAASPDEQCTAPAEPAFGWDGAPAWATFDGDRARCVENGIREFSPAVLSAFRSFWSDMPGPGGIGIRTRYAQMLGHVAGLFAQTDAVAGYDVMNEPNAFRPVDQMALAQLYTETLREVRAAEQRAGGHSHLVFFEPSAIWSTFGMGAPPDFERDDNVVYAPHLYTGGFDGGPITENAFEVAVREAGLFDGAPVLSGEWGSDPRRASDPNDPYFVEHQNLQDRYLMSATLWTWRESCGDPHKAGDHRAGRVPYVWGEFEVDCRMNLVEGLRRDLVDQLTRAYVRAAPGRLVDLAHDARTGAFTTHGIAAAPGMVLVAFYPASRHGVPSPETAGLEGVELLPADGGNVYLIGRALGGPWSVEIGATP